MPRNRSTIEDLRRVIDRLPIRTREAMVEGIRVNDIIVGAYSDRLGGVCPMLAAHRCGGRTSFVSFARAWDAFTGVKRARRATARELRVLETHLVASLTAEGSGAGAGTSAPDLRGAIVEHQAATRVRRTREAAQTGGWGFLAERQAAGTGRGPVEADARVRRGVVGRARARRTRRRLCVGGRA